MSDRDIKPESTDQRGWRPTFDMILTMVAMAVAMMVGACLGATAVSNVEQGQRDACVQGEQLRRCCSCTQAELGRCGR